MRGCREGLDTSAEPSPALPWAELDFSGATCPARGRPCARTAPIACYDLVLNSVRIIEREAAIIMRTRLG